MERLKTSQEAADILQRLNRATGIRRNFWARAALGLSLGLDADRPTLDSADSEGMELSRSMLFGEDQPTLLALIRQRHSGTLDEQDLAKVVKAHIERGVHLLDKEYHRLNRRGDELMLHLAERCASTSESTNINAVSSTPPPPRSESYEVAIPLGHEVGSGQKLEHVLNQPGGTPHLAVMGRNGTGKTRTALSLLKAIKQTAPYEVPCLVFDYAKGDIAANDAFISDVGATVISVPGQRIPLAPLAMREADPNEIGIAAHRFRDTITSVVPGLGPKQKSRCLDIIRDAYGDAGPETIGLDDVYNVADRLYTNNGWGDDSLLAVLKEMIDFPLFQPAKRDALHPFFDHSHVIDVHGLPESLRKLAVFLMLDKLYTDVMSFPDAPMDKDGNRHLRLLIVIDEAHHYLACKQPTLEKMVREVRSKGVGMWLMSQSPDDFDQPKYNFAREMGLAIVFSCVLERPKMLEALLGAKIAPQRMSQLSAGIAVTRLPETSRPSEFQAWTP